MDFSIDDSQQMVIDTVRSFTERELVPHEAAVERTGTVPPELVAEIRDKAIDAGLYAANMPTELGGGGLDDLTLAMAERAFGWTSYALQYIVARPSNILLACEGEQVQEYLVPTVRGERVECLAMSEPDAGSDLRGMTCRAERRGDEFVVNGTKHFISHADLADYVILFAASGVRDTDRGPKQAHIGAAGGLRHSRRRARRRLQLRLGTGATTTSSSTSTMHGCRRRSCSAPSTAASMSPTSGWAAPAFRWRRCASAGPTGRWRWRSTGPRRASSSGSGSGGSRGVVQAGRHAHPAA